MTHPDVPRYFDGSLFYSSLQRDHSLYSSCFHYEFFFLPGATAEDCRNHFRGEMEVRGTIWRHIDKVNEAMNLKKCGNGQDEEPASDQDTATGSGLPGLIWPENDDQYQHSFYRGLFFMYPHAGIELRTEEEKAREIDRVLFDPIFIPDWDEEEECCPSPMECPIYTKRMTAKDTEHGFGSGIFGWMEAEKNRNWEERMNEATCDAKKLGWESW